MDVQRVVTVEASDSSMVGRTSVDRSVVTSTAPARTVHALPCDGRAPAGVRRLVCARLQRAEQHGALTDTLLLATELVMNAVEHSCGGDQLWVEIWIGPGCVRVAVTDGDPERAPVLPGPEAARGRVSGLHIVDRVAQRWGCTRSDSTKTVWFELGG